REHRDRRGVQTRAGGRRAADRKESHYPMGARILQRISAGAGCPRRSDGVRESDDARKHGGGHADTGQAVMATSGRDRSPIGDLVATGPCALVWGTSWYALPLQLGVVDPVVSLVDRFSLAAALLFCGASFVATLSGYRSASTRQRRASGCFRSRSITASPITPRNMLFRGSSPSSLPRL